MTISLEPLSAYFVHIPKTGGVSLGTLLEKSYLPWQKIRINPPNLRRVRVEHFGKFRFYHAMHQGRTLFDMTGRSDLVCFTMLRDPVERTCSQIRYLQRMVREMPHTFTAEYLAEVAPIVNASLEDCLDHAAFIAACDSQIRTLGIREDYSALFAGSPDAESGRSVIRPYPLRPLMDTSDRSALLSNAISWIDTMEVVGLTERYEESVLMICDVLGTPIPSALPRLNTNPHRNTPSSDYRRTLSPRVIAQIEDLTSFDRVAYNYATEKFRERWGLYQSKPKRNYSIGAYTRSAALMPLQYTLNTAKKWLRPLV